MKLEDLPISTPSTKAQVNALPAARSRAPNSKGGGKTAEKREEIVKVRLSQTELDLLDTKRADAGCATRAGYFRLQLLQRSHRDLRDCADAAEIAEKLGRIGLAINQLNPKSSSGAKALAHEVRELREAIYSWAEG